jgi:hypothetical protein
MSWKVISRSTVGTKHQKGQIPCQDYGNYGLANDFDDVIVGAVADGAGSAKYSDVGSELAVETALFHLKEYLKYFKETEQHDLQQPISEESARKVFARILKLVVDALAKKATNQGYSLKDLACTLLVFIATPNWIAAMQIGDGFIVVRKINSDYQLLFQPDKGEYANVTTFVTSSNAESEMQVRVLVGKSKFVCASTDGLERIALNFDNSTPGTGFFKAFAGFFKPFEDGLEMNNQQQEAEDTQKWLESAEVNARTDDDKTLLLCLYKGHTEQKVVTTTKELPLESQEQSTEAPSYTNSSSITRSRLRKNFLRDLMTVSFICYVFAGCLWNIIGYLSVQNQDLWAIFLAIYIVTFFFVSIVFYITFTNLSKFYRRLPKGILKTFLCASIAGAIGLYLGKLLSLPLQYLSFR